MAWIDDTVTMPHARAILAAIGDLEPEVQTELVAQLVRDTNMTLANLGLALEDGDRLTAAKLVERVAGALDGVYHDTDAPDLVDSLSDQVPVWGAIRAALAAALDALPTLEDIDRKTWRTSLVYWSENAADEEARAWCRAQLKTLDKTRVTIPKEAGTYEAKEE